MFFLKIKKNYIYLLTILFSILLIGIITPIFFEDKDSIHNDTEANAQQVNVPVGQSLKFISHYVVGKDSIIEVKENLETTEELKKKYVDWKITRVSPGEIVFEKEVEDIAPELKVESYFSLGPDGYLTLYHGNLNDNEIIQTFFRIDIEKLESSLPNEPIKQLYDGIPIQDLAEYNSVLSTFSEFALD